MVPKCQCKDCVNSSYLLNYQNHLYTLPRRFWACSWGGVTSPWDLPEGSHPQSLIHGGARRHNPIFSSVTVLTTVEHAGFMIKLSSQNHSDMQCPLSSVPAEKSNLEKRIYRWNCYLRMHSFSQKDTVPGRCSQGAFPSRGQRGEKTPPCF